MNNSIISAWKGNQYIRFLISGMFKIHLWRDKMSKNFPGEPPDLRIQRVPRLTRQGRDVKRREGGEGREGRKQGRRINREWEGRKRRGEGKGREWKEVRGIIRHPPQVFRQIEPCLPHTMKACYSFAAKSTGCLRESNPGPSSWEVMLYPCHSAQLLAIWTNLSCNQYISTLL